MDDLSTFQFYVEPDPSESEDPGPSSSQEDSSVDDSENEQGEQRRQRRRRQNQCTDYTKSKEFSELVSEILQNVIKATGLQIKNSSALIRRSVLLFMEFLAKTKLDVSPVMVSWVR